jgi:predicted RNA binding protein with dsRBD fold (UPF0201 family)
MSSSTTVKVTRTTLAQLEKLREELKANSLEDAIRVLIQRHRSQALETVFGADRGRVRPFTEEDRGEDR